MNHSPRTGPAVYTIIGGGCFGTFYTRQLLRYADRAGGPVARIVIIDRDPSCRVAREVQDPRVEIEVADWADHLSTILPAAVSRVAAGEPVTGRIVPSPFASHIMLEALRRVAAPRAVRAGAEEARGLLGAIATPFRRDLENGSFALSFATWVCPVNCIEPRTCPAIAAPLSWNMGRAVANHLRERTQAVASVHVLQCLHEAFGVGTIPLADLAREAIALGKSAGMTRTGVAYAVVATVSTCHGLAGALRLEGEPDAKPAPGLTAAPEPHTR